MSQKLQVKYKNSHHTYAKYESQREPLIYEAHYIQSIVEEKKRVENGKMRDHKNELDNTQHHSCAH